MTVRNALLIFAALSVICGVFLIAVPAGLIAFGLALGAVAYLSEE